MPLSREARRLDREVGAVLDTMLERKPRIWSVGGGIGSAEEVGSVLQDSIATHLPSTGSAAANLVLIAALLGRSPAQQATGNAEVRIVLPAVVYAALLDHFQFGRFCAAVFFGLDQARLEPRSRLSEVAGALAAALAERLCSTPEDGFSNLAVALLGICRGAGGQAVAGALLKVADALQPHKAMALLQEILETSVHFVREGNDRSQASCSALLGLALAAASLTQRALEVEAGHISTLQKQRAELQRCISQEVNEEGWQEAWLHVLELIGSSSDGERGESKDELWSLSQEDKQVLRALEEPLPEEIHAFWSGPAAEAPSVELVGKPSSLKSRGGLHVDLYADPAAKQAQDAIIAALPPARRAEALLSAAKAEALDEVIGPLMEAWAEAGEACAAVLLRQSPDGAAAWPVPVLAPVLAELVQRDITGWRQAFAEQLPPDRSLAAALWAYLCRNASAAASFWPWALSELVVARVASAADDSPRLGSFASSFALLLATTLRADLTAVRADLELAEVLRPAGGEAHGPSSAAALRLRGLKDAPLAAMVLSLTELVPKETAAEEALESWLKLLLQAISFLPTAEGWVQEAAMVCASIEVQLARIMFGSAAMRGYAGLQLRALLPDASREGDTPTVLILLLRACLWPEASPEHHSACEDIGRLTESVGVASLLLLSQALQEWPTRRLTDLVLVVLPKVIDALTVPTPQGPVKGCSLCFDGHDDMGETIPAMKSLHCLLCCVLAYASACPSEALAQLRTACDVTRAAVGLAQKGTVQEGAILDCVCQHFSAFLLGFLDSSPDFEAAENSSSVAPAALKAAALLLHSLRRRVAACGKECVAADQRLIRLEALAF
eukprot:TRINITY_DN30608_c0_g1_i1.p1 TRINITY_DN30608_c0_g1~~TRINITY_DN30608_c0_g1_i1.p1  ORF type:complete len:845 (+),score=226.51 TRINITY_DN30608_c0_g1_i1:70-2604(+)